MQYREPKSNRKEVKHRDVGISKMSVGSFKSENSKQPPEENTADKAVQII